MNSSTGLQPTFVRTIAPFVVTAALLVGCGGGGGGGGGDAAPAAPTPTTYGVSLNAAPDNQLRCEDGWPSGVILIGAGQSSCMILAINPSLAGPGVVNGTVVSATIRVGQQTGPMRFVRLRNYFRNPGPAECCSIEQVSTVFTPQANALTTVPLNFQITESHAPAPGDQTTIAVSDRIGLEVLAPDVPIPGYVGQNATDLEWLPDPLVINSTGSSGSILSNQGSFNGLQPAFNIAFVPQ